MIGFNKIKTKLKSNANNNQQQKVNPQQPQEILSKVKQPHSPTFSNNIKSTTVSRKSMLRDRKVVIFGNKGDFLSNLLVTVLSQYQCLVTLVFLQQQGNNIISCNINNNNNNNSNNNNNNNNNTIKILEIDINDHNKITELIKESDSIIACFEWCEFKSLYEQVKILSKLLKDQYVTNGINNNSSEINKIDKTISLDKQIMICYPIGVEDIEFNIENISIEVIFDPLPVTFIFYSALMQWLFIGPPSISQPHLELLLSKPTEGCYWLDCDDLIKSIVELMIQIDLSSTSKMLVLTGKDCLTCGEISNILLSECNIVVDDYIEDKNNNSLSPSVKQLQKKFFTYLQSPISIVNSPSIEEIIKSPPTSFSNFISKCKETQLFTIKPSRSNSLNKNNNNVVMNNTIATSTLTPTISSINDDHNSTDNSKPPLSVSLDPKLLNKQPSQPASPTPHQVSTNSPTQQTTSSTSSYRFVFNPFNILKYSKDFIEETLYRPSTNVNQTKKLAQDQETQQYINLLTIGFKKLFENENELELQQQQQTLESTASSSNTTPTTNITPTMTTPVNNNVNINGDTSTTSSTHTTPINSPSNEFTNEDYIYESHIEIPSDSIVDLEEEQHIHQFHHLQHPQALTSASSTTTTATSTTSSLSSSATITTTTTTTTNGDVSSTTTSSLSTTISLDNTSSTTNTTTATTTTTTNGDNWQFTTFSPKVFKAIRKYYQIDNDFLRIENTNTPFTPIELSDIVKFLEVQTIGRSGSFFYKSEDNKYFIKTIPSNEFDTFVKLFPSYYHHIKKYPNTLLPRFYGMYRLKGKLKISGQSSYYSSNHRDIIFVVMANLFYNDQKLEIKEKYDLKGSTIGRYVDINQIQQQLNEENGIISNSNNNNNINCNNSNGNSLNTSNSSNNSSSCNSNNNNNNNSNNLSNSTTIISTESNNSSNGNNQIQIQDLTFKDLNLKRKIHLGGLKRAFITQLSIDSEWMSNHGICDYSLLVGLHITDKKSIKKLKELQDPKKSLKKMDISFFKKDFNGIVENVRNKTIPIFKIRDRSNSCSNAEFDSGSNNNNNSNNSPIQQPSLSTSNTIIRSSMVDENDDDEGIIYYLGLIDILTTYNLKKRGENAIKGMLFDRTQISAINPKDYQIRFIKYIESIFE